MMQESIDYQILFKCKHFLYNDLEKILIENE